ncbi:MAG: hypothetical protein ABL308_05515 [Oceanicaulis sp.]
MPDRPAHEADDVPVRNILLFTVVPAIAIAAVLVLLFAYFVSDTDTPSAEALWAARSDEGPRLKRRPEEVREAIEVRDAAWLARGPGIDAAMRSTVQAGWREGTLTPSRAYEIRAEEDAPAPADGLPREADLRPTPAEPREADAGGEDEP